MKIEVIVTRDCINTGTRGDSAECPIAWALADKYEAVTILSKSASLRIDGQRYKGSLPTAARKFIADFDEETTPRKVLRPFIFEMNVYAVKDAR